MKIAVVGSGAWGTALAKLLCENGHTVYLWNRSDQRAEQMERTRLNPRLKGVMLPEDLRVTSELRCIKDSEMVVFATPSFAVRDTAALVKPLLIYSLQTLASSRLM